MDTLFLYLVKSALWLTAFALVYHLFLRNERYFVLNRLYLLTGLMIALLMPLLTLGHPAPVGEVSATSATVIPGMRVATEIVSTSSAAPLINWQMLIKVIFFAGLITFALRLLYQSLRVVRVLQKSKHTRQGAIRLIKTQQFSAPFSFFTYVFVNPATSEHETSIIVNHETEHIRQYHWIDLMLSELVCVIQWYNPLAWRYGHYIRQNHEYLADTTALQQTKDPALYRAVLINQLLGGEAIRLGHLFSYSLNKKRFNMMNPKQTTALQKLKILLVIPAIILVVYACTKLDENYGSTAETDTASATIPPREDGMIFFIDGNITDVHEKILNEILTPDKIASVNVYKGEEAMEKFGNLGKNGVIEINTRDQDFRSTLSDFYKGLSDQERAQLPRDIPVTKDGKQVFMVVEEMPEFPGGQEALREYLSSSINYPAEAHEQNIQGRIYVQFIINQRGGIEGVKILRGIHPLLDNEAYRVVEAMPTWKPGTQRNIPVAVSYTVPINFVLK